MTTIPGDITSEKAGPILRQWAPVCMRWQPDGEEPFTASGVVVEEIDDDRVLWWCPDKRIGSDNRARLFLELDISGDAGMMTGARWLSRHLDSWQPWEILRAVHGHSTLDPISRACGASEVGRWEPWPPAAETMRRLVMHAAGRATG